MELRWLTIINVYKDWDDRWNEEFISEYPKTPVLQFRNSENDEWVDVPSVSVKHTYFGE